MIYQCAERNYAGFIYDWEGDPTKDNSPILSRIAYGSIEYFKKQGKPTPQLCLHQLCRYVENRESECALTEVYGQGE